MIESSPLLNAVHIGVVILDNSLSIKTWNRWMAIHTGISSDKAINSKLNDLFNLPKKQLLALRRRIKTTLRLKSPTFVVASAEQYLLPIQLPLSNNSNFSNMQQDVTIAPHSETEVLLLIYDQTPLMESRKREAAKSKDLSSLIKNANKTIEKLKEAETLLVQQRDLIFYQANYDQLTGLANRHLFQDRLARHIKESNRNDTSTSLLFLDLDNFKTVNDTLGHDIGDAALIEISSILKNSTREIDTLVRFGGDEFLVLLPQTDEANALYVARKILSALSSKIKIKNQDIFITSSIGVATYPKDANSAEDLIMKADRALYIAKSKGKNQVFSYKES
ncbi:MAG: GGDEF domain-containing protein [Campylobacteraceae bacterium]|nr:GGDEF domain-containing protein [Campylobacteraceae bacterium]